ncbi:MAG: hypothetical protein CNIPEHKO_02626 [Anaerolineales bacterium]|nr:hypothetical protein [Anaerolineales bacterium]
MSQFYRSLETYQPLIYIGLILWGLFIARNMVRYWLEWRNSVYGLEREFALRRLIRSTLFGFAVLGLILAEFFIVSFVIPALPASDVIATPTLDLLLTPSNTLAPEAATQAASLPTQAAPNGMSGCVPNQIMLTAPEPGAVVGGKIELTGTADVPNLAFFKYEVSSMGSNIWATISAGDRTVKNDTLGEWDTVTLPNGDYFLQLVIIDNAGQTIGPCVIVVRVENQ